MLQCIVCRIVGMGIPLCRALVSTVSTPQSCCNTSQRNSGGNAGLQENIELMGAIASVGAIASMDDPDDLDMPGFFHGNQEDGDKYNDGLETPPCCSALQHLRGGRQRKGGSVTCCVHS